LGLEQVAHIGKKESYSVAEIIDEHLEMLRFEIFQFVRFDKLEKS
jgi:hypothetical protein